MRKLIESEDTRVRIERKLIEVDPLEAAKDELPTQQELEDFAREMFVVLLRVGVAPEQLQSEPTLGTRAHVDRIRQHALQVAEVWAMSHSEGRAVYNRILNQKLRQKKLFG